MSSDRDDDWLEALAGRGDADADSALEARLLREASRAWHPRDSLPLRPADATALQERAESLGLLRPGRRWASWWGCASCAERWQRWRRSPFGAVGLGFAALLATVVFGVLPPTRPSVDVEPVLRGDASAGAVRLSDRDPEGLRDRLAAELSAVGAEVRRYDRLGRPGIDAQLRTPPTPAQADWLTSRGWTPAPDGSLRIEIELAAP